ncbi:MAG: hypothetical protein AB1480_06485 [Nitrospirota bacterium]
MNPRNIDSQLFTKHGLYLLFDDGRSLDLTENAIERLTQEFWQDTEKIPTTIREAADFRLCSICPEKGSEGFCYALRPVIPFLEDIDRYLSYDKVTAVYVDEDAVVHTAYTTMQDALQYLSILSMTHYCRTGRKYRKYYVGVVPVSGTMQMVERMYLNMYWLHRGDPEQIQTIIGRLRDEITETSAAQVKRLTLICKNDAFVNAFYNTQVATEILSTDMEEMLKEKFSRFESE